MDDNSIALSYQNLYVVKTCKIGQGNACCRYLVMGSKGFECGKLDPSIKLALDARVATMSAQGDNCEGKPNLNELA